MTFCLENCTVNGVNISEAQVATNEPTPLEHSEPRTEVRQMSHRDTYSDSAREINAETSKDTWKSIGALAAALVGKAVQK